MEGSEWLEAIKELSPVLGIMAVVAGALITGWFQARVSRAQSAKAHESQLEVLKESHRHSLEILTLQQKREEDQRVRQFAEADRADRLVVIEYVDLLLPRLTDVASIYYLASDNRNAEELRRYQTLQRYMQESEIDEAHPEKNLGLRMAFLMFQLTSAMKIALSARWTRPLTEEQRTFLSHWESDIEPIICSGRYPGKELLYREQIEIINAEMLVTSSATSITRPLNWREFCRKHRSGRAFQDLAELVADKLRFTFDETNSLPPRRAMQCRLAIMALYLIQLSKEVENSSWNRREDALWRVATEWFKWEREHGQSPSWFVFQFGDVEARL